MNQKVKELCQGKVLQTVRPVWYYNKPEKERKNSSHPDGGFLEEDATIIVCDLNISLEGVVKAKILHNEKNIVYIVYQSGDESFFFKELNTCN